METVLWFVTTWQSLEVAHLLLWPFLSSMVLYHSTDLYVIGRLITRRLRASPPASLGPLPDAIVVIPTLLPSRSDVDKVVAAVRSVLDNRYPGRLSVHVAIDNASSSPGLADCLQQELAHLSSRTGTPVACVPVPERVGKSIAMERAIESAVLHAAPRAVAPLFFNLDADSSLGPGALEAMARRLVRPRWPFGDRPVMVTSNVRVRKSHFWRGWRTFFSVEGQLALQVAREYACYIGIGRHNYRLLPVTGVSGALYCTWTQLHLEGPRFARYIKGLGWSDLGGWWLGNGPPPYRPSDHEADEASTIGPGDDTWISWIALGARWKGEILDFSLPATPWAALREVFRHYIARPIVYEADGIVETTTPTTIRSLFRQRRRWNSSRIWLVQRRGLSLFFCWSVALFVLVDLGILMATQVLALNAFLLWPFAVRPTMWLPMMLSIHLFFIALQAKSTLLALLQSGGWREKALLLALPLSSLYHQVFNIGTLVVGTIEDVFGMGVNTGFAPEKSLIANGTGRIALAFRARRALGLAWRCVKKGDVPFGAFWFGWDETPWTKNGYAGWDQGGRPSPAGRTTAPVRPPAPEPTSLSPVRPMDPAPDGRTQLAKQIDLAIG